MGGAEPGYPVPDPGEVTTIDLDLARRDHGPWRVLEVRGEVDAYSAELARKPHCVVFTKLDLLGEDFVPPIEAPDAFGSFAISAAARTGLDSLLAGWWSQLLGMRKAAERREGSAPLP